MGLPRLGRGDAGAGRRGSWPQPFAGGYDGRGGPVRGRLPWRRPGLRHAPAGPVDAPGAGVAIAPTTGEASVLVRALGRSCARTRRRPRYEWAGRSVVSSRTSPCRARGPRPRRAAVCRRSEHSSPVARARPDARTGRSDPRHYDEPPVWVVTGSRARVAAAAALDGEGLRDHYAVLVEDDEPRPCAQRPAGRGEVALRIHAAAAAAAAVARCRGDLPPRPSGRGGVRLLHPARAGGGRGRRPTGPPRPRAPRAVRASLRLGATAGAPDRRGQRAGRQVARRCAGAARRLAAGGVNVTAEAIAEGAVLGLRAAVVMVAFAVYPRLRGPGPGVRALRPIAGRSALTATLVSRLVPVAAAEHPARLRDASRLRGPGAAPVGRAARPPPARRLARPRRRQSPRRSSCAATGSTPGGPRSACALALRHPLLRGRSRPARPCGFRRIRRRRLRRLPHDRRRLRPRDAAALLMLVALCGLAPRMAELSAPRRVTPRWRSRASRTPIRAPAGGLWRESRWKSARAKSSCSRALGGTGRSLHRSLRPRAPFPWR